MTAPQHADEDWDQFIEWLKAGIAAGWISDPVCQTHNGAPLRDWEEAEFDEGYDPCVLVARVWKDGYV